MVVIDYNTTITNGSGRGKTLLLLSHTLSKLLKNPSDLIENEK